VNQVSQELHAAGESLNQSIAGTADAEAAPAAATPAPAEAVEAPSASGQMDLGLESAPVAAPAAAPKA
jgi:hypothetical protein